MTVEFDYHRLSNGQEDSLSRPPPQDNEHYIECDQCVAHTKVQKLHRAAHTVNIILIVTLLGLLVHSLDASRLVAVCWNMHYYYSPVNAALANQPHIITKFNGSLWYDSPFKGPPTPATEEAWHSIMQYGLIAVTASDYGRVNHSTRTAVQFPPEAGGGYMATTVGTHQLHCLHYLWQDHHHDYFPDVIRKIQDVPDMYERHFEHCIDIIRQSIMCQFDTGLVTYDWVLQHPNPTPNANTMHKCVDWDVAQEWLQERAVQIPDGFKWKQPEGQESLPWNP